MSPIWVVVAYGCAVALSLILLHFFHARAWYWHALSIALALTVGLTPLPADDWRTPLVDLAVGSVFVFLLVWGVGAPFFRAHHTLHHKAG